MNDLVYIGVAKEVDLGEGKRYHIISDLSDEFKRMSKSMDSILLLPSNTLPQSATGASPEDLLGFAKKGVRAKGKTSK